MKTVTNKRLFNWEFDEVMPEWLVKAKEMNEELKAKTDVMAQYKLALR